MSKRQGQSEQSPAMEIEEKSEVVKPAASKPKKDLLRFEKPHYDVYSESKYADEKEFMIRKLMEERKKPKFELLPQSSLLREVRDFIPLLKAANKQVEEATTDVRIDQDLQLEDSSSEESSDGEADNDPSHEEVSMPVEETHDHSLSGKHVEMNILVAKIPEPEEQPGNPSSQHNRS